MQFRYKLIGPFPKEIVLEKDIHASRIDVTASIHKDPTFVVPEWFKLQPEASGWEFCGMQAAAPAELK